MTKDVDSTSLSHYALYDSTSFINVIDNFLFINTFYSVFVNTILLTSSLEWNLRMQVRQQNITLKWLFIYLRTDCKFIMYNKC